MWTRTLTRTLIAVAVLALPQALFAQTGTIAGVVKDSSGAVLPGVTVEAASPALIEKVRSAVTDDQGQYKVVELRPGLYTVTFTLPGFRTVRREGIELSAAFTANISVELAVGNVSETVTVTGESPIVDVQNATQRSVITRETLESLPTGRSFQALAVLVPGLVVAGAAVSALQDVGGTVGDRQVYLSVHGSRGREMPLLLDGLRYNNMLGWGGGGETLYHINSGTVQEYTMEVSGMSAEAQVSGPRVNVIPKEGGNDFRGSAYGVYTGAGLIANNLPDSLKSQGVTFGSYDKIWDFVASGGGPVIQNRLWFYSAYRNVGDVETPPNTFYDTNPLDFVYTPDRSRPAQVHIPGWSLANRLTWQATPKHKLGVFYDKQGGNQCPSALSSTVAPEGAECRMYTSVYVGQATWRAPLTNRLLLDVGTGVFNQLFNSVPFLQGVAPTYSVLESTTNTRFRAPTSTAPVSLDHAWNGKANLTYVTGSHAVKAGALWQYGYNYTESVEAFNGYTLTTLNGVPSSVSVTTAPYSKRTNLKIDIAEFAQDQWTVKRLTLNLGIRLDHVNAYDPEIHLPPVRFVGARDFAAVTNVPNWWDLSPRLGAAWDLLGNGKTAVKVSLGRYVVGMTNNISNAVNPINASVNSTTRSWSDRNGDFVPQDDELGPLANANFGKTIITTRWDPKVTEGFGKRPYNWESSAGIQHQLAPGVAVNAAYFHRQAGNYFVNDNLLVSPQDYDTYCITAPVDPRLPGGGNRVCDLWDINPAKFGRIDNLVTSPDGIGKAPTEVWNGADFSMNMRVRGGLMFQGGVSTGRVVTDLCDIAAKVDNAAAPNDGGRSLLALYSNLSRMPSPSKLYCHVAQPFQTQVKIQGVYPLPWWGLQASATFQGIPGTEIDATFVATNAQIAPSLGRNLAGGVSSATVELIAPNTQYGDRVNQLDGRLAKTFTFGHRRLEGWIDAYNLLNANPVLTYNTRYGSAWLTPQAVLPGRLFKFGGQFDF